MPKVPLDLQDARSQADMFITKLQSGYGTGKYGDLTPTMDLEDNTSYATTGQGIMNLTVEEMIQWANEFRNYFEAQTGRTLGFYSDENFLRTRNNMNHDDSTGGAVAGTSGNLCKDMPLWVAGYTNYPRYQGNVMPQVGGWSQWVGLQYTSTETQSGISGNTDHSWCMPIDYLTPPSSVTGVNDSLQSDNNTVIINWTPNTELDIKGYNVYQDGSLLGFTVNPTYTISGLAFQTTYTFTIKSVDNYNGEAIQGVDVVVTTLYDPNIQQVPLTPSPDGKPVVNIINITKSKISDEQGMNVAEVTFSFDIDTYEYSVNVNGVDYTTGRVADSGNK
jgi:hypothetical protein